jgi:hypothetical protein
MATASEILTAIDAAILSGVSGPGRIKAADGREIEYRSLNDLRAIRKDFAAIVASESGVRNKLRLGDFS